MKHTPKFAKQHLLNFINETVDLRSKHYNEIRAKNPDYPASQQIVASLKLGTYSQTICALTEQYGNPTVSYRCPLCPKTVRHENTYWVGNATDRYLRECLTCDIKSAKKAAWKAKRKPFKERYSEMVQFLNDPTDVNSFGRVFLVCSGCRENLSWNPKWGTPICVRCKSVGEAKPGDLVLRKGGGEPVAFEGKLANALRQCSIHVLTDSGVVVEENAYFVDVIKPDLVLPAERTVIEYDVGLTGNRHTTPEGNADDCLRDTLLANLGWNTIRIRPQNYLPTPDAEVIPATKSLVKLTSQVTALISPNNT